MICVRATSEDGMSEKDDTEIHRGDIVALRAIMRALRAPVGGCPWDIEQTFSTIAPYTIEEAYEVTDAIERGDMAHLKEELGDLLLQVVYHAQMAEEVKAFGFDDVAAAICRKMIRRHPHVFGDDETRAKGVEKGFWEEIKAAEKADKPSSSDTPHSVLDDVPSALPALSRAHKLQKRAARVGFDWPDAEPVFAKINEETDEIRQVVDADGPPAKLQEEVGDLLFAVVNLARHLSVDPESALRQANSKFTRRFQSIEAALAETGRQPEQASLEEMDALWDQAKNGE